MAELKTTYTDDILDESANELRKYKMISNDDGTVSFIDVTEYSQVGDSFGAGDINLTNAEVNNRLQVIDIGGSDTILQEAYKVIKDKWDEIPVGHSFLNMGYGTSIGIGYKFNDSSGYFLALSQNTRTPYRVSVADGVWTYITFTMGTEYSF